MIDYILGKELPLKVSKELKEYPEFLQKLLFYRDIRTEKEADKFLNPDYDRDTYDPFLIKGMEKTVSRLLKAIKKKEKIIIYSDYDADGIPGGVILHDFFKKIEYKDFENYIPHRHNEGYGLNIGAIKDLAKNGAKLIITVDCGITDIDEVDEANKLGVDVIVTDHHLVGEKLPSAYCILNSKQKDDTYPDDMLCGAGVAFKLVQALITKGNFKLKKGWEKWLLDMVGISTIADMVPLRNENRVLAHFGLIVLRKSPRPGLLKLLKKNRLTQNKLTEDDVGFTIGPRINAASRMDDPMRAFEMLAFRNVIEAGKIADYLDKLNNQRKGQVAAMVKEARHKLKERGVQEVVVIGNPKWRPGLLGLVANSLKDEHQKPAFVWGRDGKGEIKGSCRSEGVSDVLKLMQNTKEGIFSHVGGHKMSGGFSVSDEKIHFLEKSLCESYQSLKIKSSEIVDLKIFVDKKLSLNDVTWGNYKIIEKLSPFGMGNPKPLFLFENVEIFDVKVFGKQDNHLSLSFQNSLGYKIPVIAFFADKHIKDGEIKNPQLVVGNKISFLANMENSTFGWKNELRLRIVEVI
jgi:single-stranded-DNA-specific exonuclease